jgi:hypothetical protein
MQIRKEIMEARNSFNVIVLIYRFYFVTTIEIRDILHDLLFALFKIGLYILFDFMLDGKIKNRVPNVNRSAFLAIRAFDVQERQKRSNPVIKTSIPIHAEQESQAIHELVGYGLCPGLIPKGKVKDIYERNLFALSSIIIEYSIGFPIVACLLHDASPVQVINGVSMLKTKVHLCINPTKKEINPFFCDHAVIEIPDVRLRGLDRNVASHFDILFNFHSERKNS